MTNFKERKKEMENQVNNNNNDNNTKCAAKIAIDKTVARSIEYLQDRETCDFFGRLIDLCVDAAVNGEEVFSDEDALEIIRGMRGLKQALEEMQPTVSTQNVIVEWEE